MFCMLLASKNAAAYSYTIFCWYSWANVNQVICYVTDLGCDDFPHAVFCKEYSALAANPPVIAVDENGNATLNDRGKITAIMSDIRVKFIKENAGLLKANKITIEQYRSKLQTLSSKDDGKVSPERIAAFAKNLNAQIVNVKTLPGTNYCPGCDETQQNNMARPGNPIGGIIVKGGKNPGGNMLLSLGGGTTSPGSSVKSSANMLNLTQFNANLYVPLVSNAAESSTFGVNAGGEYFSSNKNYDMGNFTAFNITGQSSAPALAANGSGSPKVSGFKAEAGVQANFSFGAFTVTPILNGAYTSFKQKAFTLTQTSSVNGQTKTYNTYGQNETQTNGFAFIPKLRMAYYFGKLGVFGEANYTLGPTIKNEVSIFKPSGQPNAQGSYSEDQMTFGKSSQATQSTSYKAFGINIGISIGLGKSISEKGVSASKRSATIPVGEPAGKSISEKGVSSTKRNATIVPDEYAGRSISEKGVSPGPRTKKQERLAEPTRVKCDCGTDVYGKDAEACKRICQFLKDGTYGAKLTAAQLQEIKETYLNGLFINKDGAIIPDPAKIKAVSSPEDMKGKKVAISKDGKSYAFLGNQDDLVKVLSIPSNRANACSNCTTVTCNGTVYECSCVNGFCMCPLCIEINKLKQLEE